MKGVYKIILTDFIKEMENKTGIKVQLSQLAEIAGATKQLINQYKNKELPQKYADKITLYFSKYNVYNTEDCFNLKVRGDIESVQTAGIETDAKEKTATFCISQKVLKDVGINRKTSEMVVAKGDSMEPTIYQGDSLLVDTSKKEIYDGILYCINLNGKICIKRLQNLSDRIIGIISDNPKYKMIEVNKDTISIIGEIKWIGRIPK